MTRSGILHKVLQLQWKASAHPSQLGAPLRWLADKLVGGFRLWPVIALRLIISRARHVRFLNRLRVGTPICTYTPFLFINVSPSLWDTAAGPKRSMSDFGLSPIVLFGIARRT